MAVPTTQFSFSKTLTSQNPFFLCIPNPSSPIPRKTTIIRMGGGPRTYPGGVSKFQWKRMQAKKAKQLLKARLCRERQIYEMRKRAELKAAVSELERPWEVVQKAPNLFSVTADEQLKVLADRFQKPGGFDLWSDNDGPQLFRSPDGLPSARFFPKGVVHSVKPYGLVSQGDGEVGFDDGSECESEDGFFASDVDDLETGDGSDWDSGYTDVYDGNLQKNRKERSRFRGGLGSVNSRLVGVGRKQSRDDGALVNGGESDINNSRKGGRDRSGSFRNSRYSEFGDVQGSRASHNSRNDGQISRRGGLRSSGYSESGDRRGGFRSSGYSESGDRKPLKRGETRTHWSRNDHRIGQNGSVRNSRYSSDSGDVALMHRDGTNINRSRNDGRISRNGGSRNSKFYQSGDDDALMQCGKASTNRSRNNGRTSRGGGLRNSKYSSDSEVFDMSLQQEGSYGFRAKNRHF